MSWILVVWITIMSMCLTLAWIHFITWFKNRKAWAQALFVLMVTGIILYAACELWVMRSVTTEQVGTALRWSQVASWIIFISLIGFIRLYLQAGRWWLGWTIVGVRTLVLILNFILKPNINFREITSLVKIRFLGEFVTIAKGVANPWSLLASASILLLLIYAVDAMLTIWRRGDGDRPRQALWFIGAIVFLLSSALIQTTLIVWTNIPMVITVSWFYLGIALVMSYQMSESIRQTARLTVKLLDNEAKMALAVEAADIGVWEWNIPENRVWGSSRWYHLFGFASTDSITLEKIIQRIMPEDRAKVEKQVESTLDEQGGFHLEYRLILPDGTMRWISSRGRTFLNRQGKPVKAIAVSIDITSSKEMQENLQRTLEETKRLHKQTEEENLFLREQVRREDPNDEIVGESEPVLQMLSRAKQVATTDSTVLIIGETGTGKELLAQAIHHMSLRKTRPMVKVNCAALPAALIESELFGREKGAYTGAMTQQIGRFELANHSTIFLDEIGDLQPELQVKLLRVLQDGQFERLGSNKTVTTDVRVITATNRNLRTMINDGKFREDLYHRLNIFPIEVPPLRVRNSDIPILIWKFVQEFNQKMGKSIDSIPAYIMEQLKQYSWPGNIRELRNLIERAVILSHGRTLMIDIPDANLVSSPLPVTLEMNERKHIYNVLEKANWRISGKGGAAEILGLPPTTLNSRLKKLGISRPKT
jgi:formate hydrogenlyase transcriptional activator